MARQGGIICWLCLPFKAIKQLHHPGAFPASGEYEIVLRRRENTSSNDFSWIQSDKAIVRTILILMYHVYDLVNRNDQCSPQPCDRATRASRRGSAISKKLKGAGTL